MSSDIIRKAEREFLSNYLGIWVYDLTGKTENWSDELPETLEIGERGNRSLLDIFPEIGNQINDVIESGCNKSDFELFLTSPHRHFTVMLNLKRKEDGTPYQVIVYIQRAKGPIKASEKALKDILGSLARLPGSVVFTTDAKGIYTFLEGPGLSFLGIDPHLWVGRSIFDFLKDAPENLNMIRRVLKGETIHDESFFNDHYFVDRICPIFGDDGEVLGIVGFQFNVTERVKAQLELQEKTELLDNFFNSIPENAYLLDLDFNILRINTAVRRTFPDRDMLGIPCYKAVHNRETPCEFCPVVKTFETGEPVSIEYFEPMVNKSYELSSFPVRDIKTGKIVGATEMATDITVRKRMEESLRRNDAILNDLLEVLTEAVYTIDKNYTITRMNKVGQDMYPYLHPLIGRKCYETTTYGKVCPDCAAEAMFREGKVTTRRFYEKNSEDEPGLWLELTAFPQYELSSGEINGAVCVLRDITPQIELESQVDEYRLQIQDMADKQMLEHRINEARLRSILETCGAAIFFADSEGRFSYINGMFKEMFGYAEADVLGKSLESIFTQTVEKESLREGVSTLASEKNERFRARMEFKCKDGRAVWGDTNFSMIRNERSGESQLIAVILDVTAEKELMEHLNFAKQAAEEASQAKSQFLATMSHEIRTPLNGVIGISDLLMETPLAPKQFEYAKLIKSSGKSLLFLIDDILDFSKIEAGKLELDNSVFNIVELVESVMGILASRASEKNLDFVLEFGKNVPAPLGGDSGRLRQILLNLIGNALKFTDIGGVCVKVEVESLYENRIELRFSVTDTGIGIPKERQNRLFRQFSQVDASSARLYGGTGLGLAISKRLVELMDGTIHIDSEPGKGSTFWFTAFFECDPDIIDCISTKNYLKCASEDMLECMKKRIGICPRTGIPICMNRYLGKISEGKVLLLGGKDLQSSAIRSQLQAWGFNVISCDTTNESLEILQRNIALENEFRFTICDLNYHDEFHTGESFIREIQKISSIAEIPIIALCDISEDPSEKMWKHPEKLRFISKPVYVSSLLRNVIGLFYDISDYLESENRELHSGLKLEPGSSGRKIRVLVAEDNRVNQIVISEILKNAEMDCFMVNNGLAAIEEHRDGRFDIVLMDCQMPLMDGYEATGRIREHEAVADSKRIPIIALTANATSDDERKCIECGMDAYCSKPIDPKRILKIIRDHVD